MLYDNKYAKKLAMKTTVKTKPDWTAAVPGSALPDSLSCKF